MTMSPSKDETWYIRAFETTGGILFYIQASGGHAWGPFSSERAAWEWLDEHDPDNAMVEAQYIH